MEAAVVLFFFIEIGIFAFQVVCAWHLIEIDHTLKEMKKRWDGTRWDDHR